MMLVPTEHEAILDLSINLSAPRSSSREFKSQSRQILETKARIAPTGPRHENHFVHRNLFYQFSIENIIKMSCHLINM